MVFVPTDIAKRKHTNTNKETKSTCTQYYDVVILVMQISLFNVIYLLSIHILGQVVIIKINSKYLHTKLLHTKICYTQMQTDCSYQILQSPQCMVTHMYDTVDGSYFYMSFIDNRKITQSLKITMNLCTQDGCRCSLMFISYEKAKV